ncbi:MAG TPA: CHAP domain-containing protein [Candidatus Dormibacteraeota bacterium]|nr:CHAP domain-containing protein [Candidatus Dormibacteraeota bacterium]
MRGSRKLVLIVVGCAVLLSAGITAIPSGHASTQTDALRARRAQLLQELAALQPARNSASASLSQAEQAYANAQAQLLAAQQQLTALNARLLALSGQVVDDEATIVKAKQQLAALTRQSYESTSTDSWVAAVLSASTFSQAMDRLAGTSHVAEQVKNLQTNLRDKEAAIRAEQAEIKADSAKGVALEEQLAQDSNAFLVLVEQRNAALQAANGPARAIAAQIAEIDQEIAAANTPRYTGSGGSCANHFSFGQCTWYVASRRCIPWSGNAKDWYYAAAAYGFPEGHMPQVGAVVVFWPGGDGASSVGHVAYVEAVGPAAGVPAGYFKQSEMNYYGSGGGWDRVSYRVLPDNSSGIQGFIYNK